MSAFAAAAQDEDGDTIKTLQARVADLEAQLYAVGAGGVGATVVRQDHHEQHLNMAPAGWKLVPVEPNMSMTQSALKASRQWAECDAPLPRGQELWAAGVCWQAMLDAAPQPIVVGQPLTEADLYDIAGNYFADEWAQKQAVMMLKDHGIGGEK